MSLSLVRVTLSRPVWVRHGEICCPSLLILGLLYYIIQLNQAHPAKTRRDVLATITWFITTGVGLGENKTNTNYILKCRIRNQRSKSN